MSTPKVSVCVQTYNHAPYIIQALDGVLMQETDFDFEIIIGEDESSDGTRDICIHYAEQHPDRIRLFLRSREDVIFIDGRPTGRYNFVENLRAARGEYIALLDGDDYWTDPRKLQKQADLLDAHPEYALCFHAVTQVNEVDGGETKVLYPPGRKLSYRLEDIIKSNFIPNLSVMFRNRGMEDLPDWFWEMPVGDLALHVRNALHGDIGYIDEVMGVYRRHGGGFMHGLHSKERPVSDHRVRILTIFRDNLAGQVDKKVLDEALSEAYLQMGRAYAQNGDIASARQAWQQAVDVDADNARARRLLAASRFGSKPFVGMQKLKRLLAARPSGAQRKDG